VTVSAGTDRLVGQDPAAIWNAVQDVLARPTGPARVPEFWDGQAAERVVQALLEFIAVRCSGR
jgi:UDP-N-acetylglucosamine 2-epimerase (non-hydrolysing)